jgi:uncharacterized membrane protein
MQNRFKSKVVWVSTATLVLFVLKTYFGFDLPQADKLLELILLTATALGIFNNPEAKDHF